MKASNSLQQKQKSEVSVAGQPKRRNRRDQTQADQRLRQPRKSRQNGFERQISADSQDSEGSDHAQPLASLPGGNREVRSGCEHFPVGALSGLQMYKKRQHHSRQYGRGFDKANTLA